MDFYQKLRDAWKLNNSLLAVGLDPDINKLPLYSNNAKLGQLEFNKEVITATHDLVCAYKLNTAFYEALGSNGINYLKETIQFIQKINEKIPIIVDAKRADIGNTNLGSVSFIFDYLGADAITVNPYMGREALEPFLSRADKGIIVLCRTSNPGAGEFQDLMSNGLPLYSIVAQHVVQNWNNNNNCSLVVGATYPSELTSVRSIIGNDMVILIPGVGSQGGNMKETIESSINDNQEGIIVNVSRDIIFADTTFNFAKTARIKAMMYRDQINEFRQGKK